jgi:hypothetical protein
VHGVRILFLFRIAGMERRGEGVDGKEVEMGAGEVVLG